MRFRRCCFGVGKSDRQDLAELSSEKNIKLLSYNVLRFATDNFNQRNKIGRGGFGTVYKGILKDGTPIAAKVLSTESSQGVQEFLNEIDVITNVKHPNLVLLLGCCVQGANRILVYEYVENGSLDQALLGTNSERARLHWSIRSEICIGTAKGLAYLHEGVMPHIVHRDIKASNILLTENFLPKIGDFGLAKLFPDNVTHISTRVAGTTGYLAPEYAMQGQLTSKADVYSFGVLLLEIIGGKSSSKSYWSKDGKALLEMTWELYEEGNLTQLIDPILENYPEEEVFRFIKVALFCTQIVAGRRPSMTEVLHMLSKPIKLNEKELIRPGIIQDSTKGQKSSKTSSSTNVSTIPEFSSTSNTVTEIAPR